MTQDLKSKEGIPRRTKLWYEEPIFIKGKTDT